VLTSERCRGNQCTTAAPVSEATAESSRRLETERFYTARESYRRVRAVPMAPPRSALRGARLH
jgi:hypothetical protein